VTGFLDVLADAEVAGGLVLGAWYLLVLRGWGVRLLARYYGLPEPPPSPFAAWHRTWTPRREMNAAGLCAAAFIMVPATLQLSWSAGTVYVALLEVFIAAAMHYGNRRARRYLTESTPDDQK
jgi:hypothetical protein